MFGGYTEVYAYGREDEHAVMAISASTELHTSLSLDTLDSNHMWSYLENDSSTWHSHGEDLIVIAECSEVCGPIPLVTIPSKVTTDFDVSSFVVQIMSTDYQGISTTSRVPVEDTQVMMPDAMEGVHTMISYFILLDAHARGFVRPMCISYITMDREKLMQNSSVIAQGIEQATAALKHCNRKHFVQELIHLLEDLEVTKTAMANTHTMENDMQNCGESKLAEGNMELARKHLLESTLVEAEKVLQHVQAVLNKDNWIEKPLENLLSQVNHMLNPPMSVGLAEEYRCATSSAKVHTPRVIKLPLRYNYENHLRSCGELSPGGYILAMYQLHILHKHFRREQENIALCSSDEKGYHLQFGACQAASPNSTRIISGKWKCELCKGPFLPQTALISKETSFRCVDSDFAALFSVKDPRLATTRAVPKASSKGVKRSKSFPHIRSSDSFTGGVAERRPGQEQVERQWPHVHSLLHIWDTLDHFVDKGIEKSLVEVFHKFSIIHHVLYSVLIGKPLVIFGGPESETHVRALVSSIGLFVPRKRRQQIWVEPWRSRLLDYGDLKFMAAVGLCLTSGTELGRLVSPPVQARVTSVNLKTGIVLGPNYTGTFLKDLDKKVKILAVGGPLFALIVSTLADIEQRLHLWQQLSKARPASLVETVESGRNHLAIQGLSSCDLKILWHLTSIMDDRSKS